MRFSAIISASLISVLLSVSAACSAQVKQYRVRVVNEYPHDVGSYTQGLFIKDGQMYESTGQYGSSTFRKVDLKTGKALRRLDFGSKYFVEGSVAVGDSLYILTWMNNVAFLYDLGTLEYISFLSYPRQGWGITTDGTNLIASDGSSRLYFLDKDLTVTGTLNVRLHGKALKFLNELEYIDGRIWANVYTTNMIVIIDPESGDVESVIDCTGLLPRKLRTEDTDVLNGIAYDESTGKLYLTGKNWPRIYEVALEEK